MPRADWAKRGERSSNFPQAVLDFGTSGRALFHGLAFGLAAFTKIQVSFKGKIILADTHPTKREFYTRAAAAIDAELPQFGENASEAGKQISNDKVKRQLNYAFRHPDLMKVALNEVT